MPVDETDDISKKPLKKIASLRVIIYLEDLGPVLGGRDGEDVEELEREFIKEKANQQDKIGLLPSDSPHENNEDEDEEKVQ